MPLFKVTIFIREIWAFEVLCGSRGTAEMLCGLIEQVPQPIQAKIVELPMPAPGPAINDDPEA